MGPIFKMLQFVLYMNVKFWTTYSCETVHSKIHRRCISLHTHEIPTRHMHPCNMRESYLHQLNLSFVFEFECYIIKIEVSSHLLKYFAIMPISCCHIYLCVCAGAGVVVQPDDRVLPNNSLIETLSNNVIPRFQCLSGSSQSNVGTLIGPLGTDITQITTDPFTILPENRNDPGTMVVISSKALDTADVGIYTYRTPDENGKTIDFHFGIYTSLLAGTI